MRKVKVNINGEEFTQPQILLLLQCAPFCNTENILGTQNKALKYLTDKEFIELCEYDNGALYYQPTIKGHSFIQS